MAEKEQRAPGQNAQAIKDELFGFLLAGHDTTAISEYSYMRQHELILSFRDSSLTLHLSSALLGTQVPGAERRRP